MLGWDELYREIGRKRLDGGWEMPVQVPRGDSVLGGGQGKGVGPWVQPGSRLRCGQAHSLSLGCLLTWRPGNTAPE